MDTKMLTLERFEEASDIVRKVTQETKLVYSDFYSTQTGNKVYFKPENMQLTGAYKLRGAYYKISTLSDEERAKGLITASAGNHAQGVAYAAKCFGVKAVIVMPTTTPLIKVNRTKGYGWIMNFPMENRSRLRQGNIRLHSGMTECMIRTMRSLEWHMWQEGIRFIMMR